MAYPFTQDHDMIRDAVRGWAQEWYDGGQGPERVFQSGNGIDVNAWRTFSKELGMTGVAISEEFGGAGLGDLGRVVVLEELGASLCSVPFLSTCGVVADLLNSIGDADSKRIFLPKIAAGEITATYCDGHDSKNMSVKNVVNLNENCIDQIFLSRRSGTLLEIFAVNVDADPPGLKILNAKTMDPTRSFGNVNWAEVCEEDIHVIGTISETDLNNLVIQSFIGLAAECVGGAQKCLDLTLEYTGQRVQFDRTIASFQAIKHRCADMYIAIEEARSAVYYAATAEPEDKTEAALIAKATATEMFYKVAGDAIQLHGGIGFTWEYPLHFFFKRARANRTMFGTPDRDYERIAMGLLGDVA